MRVSEACDLLRACEYLFDRLVKVLAAVLVARTGGDEKLPGPRFDRKLCTTQVGDQIGELCFPPPSKRLADFGTVRHLQNPFWTHKGGGFDLFTARADQLFNQGDFLRKRNAARKNLESVARCNLGNLDMTFHR